MDQPEMSGNKINKYQAKASEKPKSKVKKKKK